jgi:hypothetical protein
MQNTTKKKKTGRDAFVKKIEKLYQNYGIDISEMDEDELERLRNSYEHPGKDIDQDLKKSEQFKDKFIDDIV